ncbi:MAG: GMC family oxidoreductase N-terminal domain-containing protein [bacterium]
MLFTYKDINRDVVEKVDVCIIGSGAGGAVMADVLSGAGLDVVVLEEGGYYTKERYSKYKPIESLKILYRDYGSTIVLGKAAIMLPLGRAVGGTTVINSGTCFRTPEHVLRDWAERFGVQNASPKEMEPYFEQVEKIINVVPVSPQILGKNGLVFKRGADALGMSNGMLLHNIKDCHGCGRCAFGCPHDAKQAVHLNFIPSAIKHGARIYANARAEKIIVESDRVTRIEGSIINEQTNNRLYKFTVSPKLLVLSAGAIYTPFLLEKNNIKLSPELGKNLTIHPAVRVTAMFDEIIQGYKGVPQGNYVDEYISEGIMLEGIFVPPEIGLPVAAPIGKKHKEMAFQYDHFAAFGVMVSDKNSYGRVNVGVDNGPFISYHFDPYDFKKLVKGIAVASEIFFAAGARTVNPAIYGVKEFTNPDDIAQLFKKKIKVTSVEMMAFHPLGTARMGEPVDHTVVNSFGKVHRLKNMFISDGSIFPTSLGVNPQITIMSFAMRNAQYIVDNKAKLLNYGQ